jgi:TRAP-type C4-dicarboxylate transport system permease small subunit
MRRLVHRIGIESARLAFALLVAYGSATGLESTCPAPTPENSSPGCEGLSYLFGGVVGFFGAILLSIVAQLIWRRRKRRSGSTVS